MSEQSPAQSAESLRRARPAPRAGQRAALPALPAVPGRARLRARRRRAAPGDRRADRDGNLLAGRHSINEVAARVLREWFRPERPPAAVLRAEVLGIVPIEVTDA